MHLHWGWAALTALALGVGLAWWTQPASDQPTPTSGSPRHDAGHRTHAHADAGPTLYRWIDAKGVVNIADRPPAGRSYTIVRIDPNRNIVPMAGSDSASTATSAPH